MDKKLILAVAGSGKTTYIVDNLSCDKRSLIITYTNGNYDNLKRKIAEKFYNEWPKNITLMTYFSFLYTFCYKPFLADKVRAKGILHNQAIIAEEQRRKREQYVGLDKESFYMTSGRYFYNNRLAHYIEKNIQEDVNGRIEKYFDELVIDEVQDISGRDFNFLKNLMAIGIKMLFVGDYNQHTYDTSRDGTTNKSLYNDKAKYEAHFSSAGFFLDNTTLKNSWRCSKDICDYISDKLCIEMLSNRSDMDNTTIEYITDASFIKQILDNDSIVKLHYKNGARFGSGHNNWGKSKGEDFHQDVCVMLNKTTSEKRSSDRLVELAQETKNKLYVAITRARGNVYLVDEE